MDCLHGRFLAHLSPDTVTADDARQQPDTQNAPPFLSSDTVIYEAPTQRPVDELVQTFHLAYCHSGVCQLAPAYI